MLNAHPYPPGKVVKEEVDTVLNPTGSSNGRATVYCPKPHFPNLYYRRASKANMLGRVGVEEASPCSIPTSALEPSLNPAVTGINTRGQYHDLHYMLASAGLTGMIRHGSESMNYAFIEKIQPSEGFSLLSAAAGERK